MKAIRFTSTALLSLLLAIAAPAYAQQEQRDEKQDHDQQKQSRPEQTKSEVEHAQQHHPQQGQQQNQKKQQDAQETQHQEQDKNQQQAAQQEQRNKQQQAQQQARNHQQPQRGKQQMQRSAWQQHGSQHWASDHRTWQQRGGYQGYRIPDDRFRGNFGPDHRFRIHGLPFLVVGGYPRFQYEGYWFSPVDPWPTSWGNDWYDNDDVYVNYVDNGYYLYDRRYPQQGIAINITL